MWATHTVPPAHENPPGPQVGVHARGHDVDSYFQSPPAHVAELEQHASGTGHT